MIANEYNIYPDRDRGTYKFYAVQGESMAREVILNLFDEGGCEVNLTGCKAFLYIMKQDKTVAVIAGKTSEGMQNTVIFPLTYQACTCAGICDVLLQVITDSGELRYDNMELTVSPSEADAAFESKSDLGPIAKIIKNGEQITRTLEEVVTTKNLMVSVLKNYSDSFSPDVSGALPVGTDEDVQCHQSAVAADINGNILLLDTGNWGATETYLTCDEGETWRKSAVQSEEDDLDMFYACVGGKVFMCVGRDKIVWLKEANGELTTETVQSAAFTAPIDPPIKRGQYVNGKYFLIQQDGIEPAKSYPPIYYNTPGAAPAYMALPQSSMTAKSIAYSDGYWYMLAGEIYHDDNQPHKAWLLRSETLANWTAIAQWAGEYNEYDMFTIRNGIATIYDGSNSQMRVKQIDLTTNTVTDKIIKEGISFYPEAVASCDLFDVAVSGENVCYTKDGERYSFFTTDFPPNEDVTLDIAIPRRRLIIADGAHYAIYRLDMLGENLAEKLNAAKANFEKLVADTEALNQQTVQAANKVDSLIVVSPVKKEIGDALAPGHIYVWVQ